MPFKVIMIYRKENDIKKKQNKEFKSNEIKNKVIKDLIYS